MLESLVPTAEALLSGWLRPEITDFSRNEISERAYTILPADDLQLRRIGIEVLAGDPLVLVTDPDRPLGRIRLASPGHNNVIVFDNLDWRGSCTASLRLLGADSLIVMNDIADGYVQLHDVLLRSDNQVLFWGAGATAVGMSIEMDGDERSCIIGDDALISNDVWIRNYDMHAIHDLASGAQINRPACDTVLERHVWLGQDALLLNCESIGMGSIIGARSLVKGVIPPHCVAVGTPARVQRHGASWGRSGNGMTQDERRSIGLDGPASM
ncbi:MAG: hypothetical protein NT133_26895 [Alphaproteobacteria bacterium]|nr:hypothetical protein [Alphaproteobacteria bacterium]